MIYKITWFERNWLALLDHFQMALLDLEHISLHFFSVARWSDFAVRWRERFEGGQIEFIVALNLSSFFRKYSIRTCSRVAFCFIGAVSICKHSARVVELTGSPLRFRSSKRNKCSVALFGSLYTIAFLLYFDGRPRGFFAFGYVSFFSAFLRPGRCFSRADHSLPLR